MTNQIERQAALEALNNAGHISRDTSPPQRYFTVEDDEYGSVFRTIKSALSCEPEKVTPFEFTKRFFGIVRNGNTHLAYDLIKVFPNGFKLVTQPPTGEGENTSL